VYRYGGEELLLLLPETEAEGADIVAQRAVTEIATLRVAHRESPQEVVTISAGATTVLVSDGSWERVVARADQALYAAKHRGRNQAVVLLPPSDEASHLQGAAPEQPRVA
jgi:diguanylate cyclase (GGDEF)-like protein